jgi:hypothetical protein
MLQLLHSYQTIYFICNHSISFDAFLAGYTIALSSQPRLSLPSRFSLALPASDFPSCEHFHQLNAAYNYTAMIMNK